MWHILSVESTGIRVLNVGLIGHKFMGRAHSHALHDMAMFFPEVAALPVRKVLCGIGEDLEAAARQYGWEQWTESWHDVIENPEIDIVDIATPGNTHCEIALAAAQAGKHVICEKPLALNAAEARAMLDAAERSGVRHMVNFNYRRVPAVALARKLIREGRLGDIYYFRATYWQDWPLDPQFPFLWRMDRNVAGAGSMADKGSHIVNLARFLVGEIEEIAAATEIFVKQRPLAGGGMQPVTTDDAAAFLARFDCGALGLFGTSRMSAGHKNSLGFEINGSKGSIIFDLERLNELQVYFAGDSETEGFRTVMATDARHPYVNHWWPPGHIIGWEHTFVHQYFEFIQAVASGKPVEPSFHDGWRVHLLLDAIERAAREKRWVKVNDV